MVIRGFRSCSPQGRLSFRERGTDAAVGVGVGTPDRSGGTEGQMDGVGSAGGRRRDPPRPSVPFALRGPESATAHVGSTALPGWGVDPGDTPREGDDVTGGSVPSGGSLTGLLAIRPLRSLFVAGSFSRFGDWLA